jgi:holo-[acyl-carrier protein] synthase
VAALFSFQAEWAYSFVRASSEIAARIQSRYNRTATRSLHSIARFRSEAHVIVGLGLDIAEIDRIEAALTRHGSPILERLYTPAEVAYCESFRGKFERYAGRFAAKEAAMKALGTGWRFGIRWRDIEVAREPSGKPSLRLHGVAGEFAKRLGVKSISLTITHSGNLALAEVIFEN